MGGTAELLDAVLSHQGVSTYRATDTHTLLAFAAFAAMAVVVHVIHFRIERLTTRKKAGMKGDINMR